MFDRSKIFDSLEFFDIIFRVLKSYINRGILVSDITSLTQMKYLVNLTFLCLNLE